MDSLEGSYHDPGSAQQNGAPQPNSSTVELLVYVFLVMVAVVGIIILLVKCFGGNGSSHAIAAYKARSDFSAWFPVR